MLSRCGSFVPLSLLLALAAQGCRTTESGSGALDEVGSGGQLRCLGGDGPALYSGQSLEGDELDIWWTCWGEDGAICYTGGIDSAKATATSLFDELWSGDRNFDEIRTANQQIRITSTGEDGERTASISACTSATPVASSGSGGSCGENPYLTPGGYCYAETGGSDSVKRRVAMKCCDSSADGERVLVCQDKEYGMDQSFVVAKKSKKLKAVERQPTQGGTTRRYTCEKVKEGQVIFECKSDIDGPVAKVIRSGQATRVSISTITGDDLSEIKCR